MRTWNEIEINCSPEQAFNYARRVDLWPERLAHYRKVRVLEGDLTSRALVEMAAYRQFEKLNWPVWWISKMEVLPGDLRICYEHIRGVTKGMEVEWRLEASDNGGTKATIVHEWKQPPVGRRMAGGFIGHVFVHHIADQTLLGLKQAAEQQLEVAVNA
ncbi:ribosome-associated toxin RatA of RatAB toxin-antitoxin module [Paenibacillus phyllosphaerae]|uniref:Ribosome-associated toxin RatA of RatAB toxin-antitoxin module n=1 Tax=Paenibacillus phyllosphaerae TaxID=274593 RepID=A0A7W5AYB8_9BACL|nr:SRPBCC family protein [Paenibacillus phyllosphaerae]MBB3110391.1 ribosome-associated toxin RatA of RatAB toxin-antitoxin module [Paenibacillus phyllosphaerae]